jgi:hypothetical protein
MTAGEWTEETRVIPWGENLDSSSDDGLSRARRDPPFVVSVGSVGKSLTSNTSNSPPPPSNGSLKLLTSASNTSNTSNSLIEAARTGEWLSNTVFEPLRFAIPGIIPEGFAVVAGPPKSGKSWLALDWLLSIAAGGRALGQIAVGAPRRVLYLALEDSDRRMQDRCRRILGPDQAIPPLFAYLTEVAPHLVGATIREWLEAYPDTALVVVDTIGKVMPPIKAGEVAYQRDYSMAGYFQSVARQHPGLAVVGLHHTRKTVSADFVEAVSGTQGIAGAADTVVVLQRDRNSADGLLKLTSRELEEAEYALTYGECGWVIAGADLDEAADVAHERKDVTNLSPKMLEVLAYVERHPEGVTSKEVTAQYGKSAYTMLSRLTEHGYIERPDGGRGVYVMTKVKKGGTS